MNRNLGLLLALSAAAWGCKSKTETPSEPAPVVAATPAEAQTALKAMEVPQSVIAFGGTLALEESLGKLQAVANKAMSTNMSFVEMAKAIFQGTGALKSAAALDAKKPVRFVLADPKKYRNPTVVVIGITSEEALVQALPATGLKQNDEGNAYSYLKNAAAKVPVYVNFLPGYVVMTREAPLFAEIKDFLGSLSKLPQSDLGYFTVRLDHVLKVYDGKTDGALSRLKATLRSIQKRVGPAAVIDLQAILATAERVLLEGDELQLGLRAEEDGVQLVARAVPKADTELAKLLKLLKPEHSDLQQELAQLPADAPFWLGADVDLSQFADTAFSLFTRYGLPMLGEGGEALQAQARPLFDAIAAGTGSSFVFAGLPEAQGLEFAGLFAVRDQAKLQEAQAAVTQLLADPTLAAAQEKMGVTLAWTPEAMKAGDLAVSALTTKTPGLFPGVSVPTESHVFLALGAKLGVLTYGDNAQKAAAGQRIERLMAAPGAASLAQAPLAKRALKFAASQPFLMAAMNPVSLIHAIKMGGQNPLAPYVEGIDCQSGLSFSMGTDDQALVLALDLPVELLQKGAAVLDKAKGAF